MDEPIDRITGAATLPEINRVGADRVGHWLRAAWDDLQHAPGASLGHGALLAGLGWLVLFLLSTHIDLVAAAMSGFLLVGPVFAAAFYELSRLREAGLPATLDKSLDGAARRARSLLPLGLLLAALALVWALVSDLLFEHTFGVELPALSARGWQTVLEWDYAGFQVTYLATGAVFALMAFALSAVSAPLMFDRDVDLRTGLATGVRAVAANPQPMVAWALTIAALTALGFATFLVGLVIVLPLLGHATWHAYRDLVR